MRNYKLTIIYTIIFVLPFVAYVLWALYSYILFGITSDADRFVAAFTVSSGLVGVGIILGYNEGNL